MSFLVGAVCANRASADARASNWPIRVTQGLPARGIIEGQWRWTNLVNGRIFRFGGFLGELENCGLKYWPVSSGFLKISRDQLEDGATVDFTGPDERFPIFLDIQWNVTS